MRRYVTIGVAFLAVVVGLVAGAVGASAEDTATLSGPQLTPSIRTVVPGQRIDVVFTGWSARYATLSVCGNLAKRGSADCNMVQSTGVRLTTSSGEESPVQDMVVATPPTDCPCVIRAVGGDNGEVGVAAIDLVGHPSSPIADPDLGQPLIDIGLTTAVVPDGLPASVRRSLGGAASYQATVTVRNLTTELLSTVAVHGRVSRTGDTVAEFDLEPGEIGPGRTWTGTAEVTLPAPVIGTYEWDAVASGAGPVSAASTSMRAVPWALLLLGLLLVGDLVAVAVRRIQRRRGGRMDHGPVPEPALAGPPEAPELVSSSA